MEFLVTVVNQVVEGVFGFAKAKIRYLMHYRRNVAELRSRVQELERRRDGVQRSVDAAHRNLEEILEEVQDWLEKAAEAEVSSTAVLEARTEPRWNLRSRYRISRRAVKAGNMARRLLESGDFRGVSRLPPLPGVEPMRTDYLEGLDSMELVKKQVMEALVDVGVRVIGVVGMGGVGKTTLVKRINNELKGSGMFKKVIMVTVSSNPDVRRLQDQIAARMGLGMDPGSDTSVRAERLLNRLRDAGEGVLIILDDVWMSSGMADAGIPVGYSLNDSGCKIIVTTRLGNVCRGMWAQRTIRMEGLTYRESWTLFKTSVGEVVDRPDIRTLAEQVSRECGGLPLAITTVGLSLRMEDKDYVWQDTLTALRRSSPAEVEGLEREVINPLKFSYDRLASPDLKLCFLFCSLFPEDQDISIGDLMWYGIGEGFLRGSGLPMWSNLLASIERLKSSGLLLNGDQGKQHVKIHDVVRDVAISVASSDENGFYVKAGVGLSEWLERENLEGCKRISLMNNKISSLPDQHGCKELKTLLLQKNRELKNMSGQFFEGMSKLLNLDLSDTGISSLPTSIWCLTNLQTLNLRNVNLHELPEGIKELVHLRVLNLTYTGIEIIRPNVISKLSRLEQLYLLESFNRWELSGAAGSGNLAAFAELASLRHLNAVAVEVVDVGIFNREAFPTSLPENLVSFVISAGSMPDNWAPLSLPPRAMKLEGQGSISLWVKMFLKKTCDVILQQCQGLKSITELDYEGGGFTSWERLEVTMCDQVEHLTNTSRRGQEGLVVLANLESLSLEDLMHLKSLCDGPPPLGFLTKLRSLKASGCDKLVVLFSPLLVSRLQVLERIEITDCNSLMEIFNYEKQEQHPDGLLPKLVHMHLAALPQLTRIFMGKQVPVGTLQNLKEVFVSSCGGLRSLFSSSLASGLVQLEKLTVRQCILMEQIIGEDEVKNDLMIQDQQKLPKLRELFLHDLPRLKVICHQDSSCSGARRPSQDWPSLEVLLAKECPNLRRVFADEQSSPELACMVGDERWFQGLEWDEETTKQRFQNLLISERDWMRRSQKMHHNSQNLPQMCRISVQS